MNSYKKTYKGLSANATNGQLAVHLVIVLISGECTTCKWSKIWSSKLCGSSIFLSYLIRIYSINFIGNFVQKEHNHYFQQQLGKTLATTNSQAR